MGLTFSVGNPADAFIPEFAKRVRSTLASHFEDSIILDSKDDGYWSEEVAWSGWKLLQETAIRVVSADRVPHLLSMEAWSGCYVPAETQPGSFKFEGETTPLAVASLPALISELEAVGTALDLPIDETGLRALAEKYADDDDLVDEDMDLQTYAHFCWQREWLRCVVRSCGWSSSTVCTIQA